MNTPLPETLPATSSDSAKPTIQLSGSSNQISVIGFPPQPIAVPYDGSCVVPSLANSKQPLKGGGALISHHLSPPLVPDSSASDPPRHNQTPTPANDYSNFHEQEPGPSSPIRIFDDKSDYPSQERSSTTSGPLLYSKDLSFSTNPISTDSVVPHMVGAGLANLGNTCFLNAILQCFTHTVPLLQGLRSWNHPSPCDDGSQEFCVLRALREQIEQSVANPGTVLSPSKLVNNLDYISSDFRRYQQEDAHEFLQCFLDKLERCFLNQKTKDRTSSDEHYNLVDRVFGGRLVSKLRCGSCGHCSDTYEPLIDLSLEIENVDTLSGALDSFTKVEKIDAKFKCESCKEEVSMEKQLMLDQAPSVAAFHLKRFKSDGSFVEKIDKHLEFPLELDLLPYTFNCQNNEEGLKYDLYAIVVHVGLSSTSGHYFSFVRSSPDIWHRLDDSEVTRVLGDTVLSQDAYILFYSRQGTPWFSSVMEAEKPFPGSTILSTSPKSVLENVDRSCNLISNHSKAASNVEGWDAVVPKGFAEQMAEQYDCRASDEVIQVNDIADSAVPLGAASCPPNANLNINCGGINTDSKIVDDVFGSLTPPNSPSPHASPEPSYRISRDHLKPDMCGRSKTPSNKPPPMDAQRNAAVSYLKKFTSGSKRHMLLEALTGEDSLPQKRKHGSSLYKKDSLSNVRRKSNHGSFVRPAMAQVLQ